ncbi:MAG: acetyltransferase [Bacteroidales bacterium]|nr:acetyltransferase [Bacteroidales bacterium]
MIIVGAGALGLETLAILLDNGYNDEIVFFDDDKQKTQQKIFDKFDIITDKNEQINYLHKNPYFIVSIGHPRLRSKKYNLIIQWGGIPVNVISKKAHVFPFLQPFEGCIIEPSAGISHGVKLGTSCAIHINCTIGHQVQLGNFVNIGPGANVVGPCNIGSYSYISVGAVVHPHVTIGNNAFIGSNVVVNRDVADFETFLG